MGSVKLSSLFFSIFDSCGKDRRSLSTEKSIRFKRETIHPTCILLDYFHGWNSTREMGKVIRFLVCEIAGFPPASRYEHRKEMPLR
ncbi:MAG: hypothetical protein C4527_11225 [Candidatus Omnitrophota bacterium]|nr:MAG: hypothetical protein C4527_11225 [Candidatus Omnitrophota bacterium]